MKKFILIGLLLLFCSIAEAKTVTLYCRSDTHTINTITGYILAIANSSSSSSFTTPNTTGMGNGPYPLHAEFYVKSVSILHSDGSETSLGANIALNERIANTPYGQLENATWSCPEISMMPTDALKVVLETYCFIVPPGGDGNPGTATRTFVTGQLGWTKLNASAWTVYKYDSHYWTAVRGGMGIWYSGGNSTISHGDSTHPTYIYGIDYTGIDVGYATIY